MFLACPFFSLSCARTTSSFADVRRMSASLGNILLSCSLRAMIYLIGFSFFVVLFITFACCLGWDLRFCCFNSWSDCP